MEPKFKVRELDCGHGRGFYTNVEVGKIHIEDYQPRLLNDDVLRKTLVRTQGHIVADMVTDILHIEGVNNVFVEPYQVSVFLKSTTDSRTSQWWERSVDHIVRNAFKRLAGLSPTPQNKVVVDNNPTRRTYHTNFLVCRSRIQDFYRPLRDSSEQYLTEIGSDGAKLVRKLMDLPGVIEIWIRPYEVSVNIGKAFDFDECIYCGKSLGDKIEDAFKDVFSSDIWFTEK